MDNIQRQAYELRFQLRAGEVYDRIAKRLRAELYPPIELEARIVGVVGPLDLIASAENALGAIRDTQGSEVVKQMLIEIVEEWLTGMTIYRVCTAENGPGWMLRAAIIAATRATEDLERLEEIILADQDDEGDTN
ncbi:hypothetical protein [Nocardia sp. NPDC059236]|uniref:hypothetical protein n=1 Tax=Nocardia sp. NPDC059236 TaxID=3346783 RepID=UPI0036BD014C